MVRRMELIKPVAWYASRQVTIAPSGASPLAQSTIMRIWWNWQTHKFEGLEVKTVQVRLLLSAPHAGVAELADARDLKSRGQ